MTRPYLSIHTYEQFLDPVWPCLRSAGWAAFSSEGCRHGCSPWWGGESPPPHALNALLPPSLCHNIMQDMQGAGRLWPAICMGSGAQRDTLNLSQTSQGWSDVQ